MGYEVHITRADHWAENKGYEISVSEWHHFIDTDPDLRLAEDNGAHFAVWDRHPDGNDAWAWLDWCGGNIVTKNPDKRLLKKMLEIAERLDAKVQGDDGEVYGVVASTSSNLLPSASLWGNTSLLSLLLSLVALAILLVLLPLDSLARQAYPVSTPMPLMWALPLAGATAIGTIAWLSGTVFAAVAFVFRLPSRPYAGAALAINAATAVYIALM